jgi:hypothetical protein
MNKARTFISYMVALLSVATAVLSCSVEMHEAETPYQDRTVLVTGSVSDMGGTALEDITITFKAYPQNDAASSPVISETTYTSNKGTYSLHTRGSAMPLMCIITAEDKNGAYDSQTKQVFISWKGIAFDEAANMFVVNDCNFQLNRK